MMMFKKQKTEENKKDEKKYPNVIVGCFIIDSEGKILLAKSRKWNDKYTIFGGHVEFGEEIKEAVVREAKEETGLDVKIIGELGISETVLHPDFHEEKHFVFMDYLCASKAKDGDIKICDREFYKDDYKWVSLKEAREMNIAIGTRQVLEKYEKFIESQETLNGWKRCQADFENYRKMQDNSRKELKEFVLEDLALQILPVLDNFQMSLSHVPKDQKNNSWVEGILHIQRQLETILKDNGIEEIEAKVGDKFDPNFHEAVHQESENNEKKSEDKIKKIIQKGYKIGDKVIRAVKVVVN
jgi:nucleoside triphosphatase